MSATDNLDNEFEQIANRQPDGKFGKGNALGGRKRGARHKLSDRFIKALHDDFKVHGPQVITEVRQTKPDVYLKTITSLVPRDFQVSVGAAEDMPTLEISFMGFDGDDPEDDHRRKLHNVPGAHQSGGVVLHDGKLVQADNVRADSEADTATLDQGTPVVEMDVESAYTPDGKPKGILKNKQTPREQYPRNFSDDQEYE